MSASDSPLTPPLAVYVHWPFCERKCPYCDFNSHVTDSVDHAAWRVALLADLAHEAAETQGETVGSIFFGGGTPSLMAPETAATVIEAVKSHWPTTDDLEITLEANPSSVEALRFRNLADAGVNRLSLGVQAFDDTALKFLGRLHDLRAAQAAIQTAHETVSRVSFDLIYARPDQTADDWRNELAQAKSFFGEHVSVYQLTIEPGTPFFREGVAAADEAVAEALYDLTQEALSGWGRAAYEVSNHATPGAACRHNLNVWRGGAYVGVGPGAHGRVKTASGWSARHRIHDPARWLAKVQTDGFGTGKDTVVDAESRAEEIVMVGLRLTEGLNTDRLQALTGIDPNTLLDTDGLHRMVSGGFVTEDGPVIRATPAGMKRLNAVISVLLGGTAAGS